MVPKENALNLIHGLQRNQTKLCCKELAHHCGVINTICKLQAVFLFWPCDEKKETATSCDNWIDFKGKGSRGNKREKI